MPLYGHIYVGKYVITCYRSLIHQSKKDMSGNFYWKNRLKEESALLISARVQQRFVCTAAGVSVPTAASSQYWASFVFSQASQCCFYPPRSPTCRFCRRLGERGKVWLEQLVALATLCATAADWNRNWPIHVSLQAGSGPCLVLTDYLISIQTARVSAPLLRSLEKRPRPASFWKPPEPSSLLPFPVLITHSFVPLLLFCFFSSFPPLLLPPLLLLLIPHPLPSYCLSLTLLFCEEMRTKILKFEVCCGDRPWRSPTAPLLPSIVSPPEREYCVFDA